MAEKKKHVQQVKSPREAFAPQPASQKSGAYHRTRNHEGRRQHAPSASGAQQASRPNTERISINKYIFLNIANANQAGVRCFPFLTLFFRSPLRKLKFKICFHQSVALFILFFISQDRLIFCKKLNFQNPSGRRSPLLIHSIQVMLVCVRPKLLPFIDRLLPGASGPLPQIAL